MEQSKATILAELSRIVNSLKNTFVEKKEHSSKIYPTCNHKVIPYDVRHSLKVHPTHCTCSHFYFYEACRHL